MTDNKGNERMGWDLFASGVVDRERREAVTAGLTAAIQLYYDDYSDAVELDGEFHRTLEKLWEYAETDDLEFYEFVLQVQENITRETRRTFKKIEA